MTMLSVVLVSASALGATGDSVLLDFSATWCGPCQQMNPIVSRLQRQGHPIRKVDIDRDPALARKYRISAIPAFVLVVKGKELGRIEGATTENQLKNLLAKIPRPPEPRRDAATAEAKQPPSQRGRGLLSSLFGKKEQDRQRNIEQPPTPPEEPVFRAKHDGLDGAVGATVVDPLAASVRVRVKDDDSVNFGSGTIIDSRPGQTIVLTCGHIFRNVNQSSRIEVDVFIGNRHETFVGKVIRYDTKADVGLCAIPTDTPLPVSQVAPAASRVAKNDRVFSVGCGGGESPTQQHLLVTALNRYLGPDTVECTGVPAQGRSGGGLFNRAGEVIGVCIWADPRDRRGLYAGLRSIHELLDQAELARLYRREASPREPLDRADEPTTELATSNPRPSSRTEWPDGGGVRPTSFASVAEPGRPLKARADGGVDRSDAVRSGSNRAGEAEVVCIIRPLNNPRAASRVVIINRASPKFVSYLNREMEDQPQLTMRTVKYTDSSPAGPQRYRRSVESR